MKTIIISYTEKRELELINLKVSHEVIGNTIAVHNFTETQSKEDFIETLDTL